MPEVQERSRMLDRSTCVGKPMEGGGLFPCVQKFELKGLWTNSTPNLGSRFVELGRTKFFCLNERYEDSPHLIEAQAPNYTNLSY